MHEVLKKKLQMFLLRFPGDVLLRRVTSHIGLDGYDSTEGADSFSGLSIRSSEVPLNLP